MVYFSKFGLTVVAVEDDYVPIEEHKDPEVPTDSTMNEQVARIKVPKGQVLRMRITVDKKWRKGLKLTEDHGSVKAGTPFGKMNLHARVWRNGTKVRWPLIRPCEQLDPRRTPEFVVKVVKTSSHTPKRKADGTMAKESRRNRLNRMGDIVVRFYLARVQTAASVGEEDGPHGLGRKSRSSGANEALDTSDGSEETKFRQHWIHEPKKDLDEDEPFAIARFYYDITEPSNAIDD